MTTTRLESELPVKTTRQTTRQTTTSEKKKEDEKNESVFLALAAAKQRVEKHLQALLQARPKACEPLRSAMYEGIAEGKRMRPFLLFASNALAEAVSTQNDTRRAETRAVLVEDAAAALEMVHGYSLIHDDLPAMDNDTLRRGQPTLHLKVGEGQAILAGDALLTLAFEVLAACNLSACNAPWETRVRLKLCFQLAHAAGAQGMAGGQSWDLEAEQQPTKHAVCNIHALKTGALLRAACAMGACCADGDEKLQKALDSYATNLGNAYQTIDDLRDEQQDRRRRGENKAILPLFSSAKRASMREEAVSFCRRAERSLEAYEVYGAPAALLRAFARFLPTRIPLETP